MTRLLSRAWVACAAAFVVALVWHHMTMRGDSFWSLAGGDWILSRGETRMGDPFSFASTDAPFVLTMPAFQVGGAWLVARVGLRAFMLACALATASGVLLLWWTSARSLGARVVSFGLVLFDVELGAGDASARGQTFGDLAFSILLVFLFRLRRGARVPAWAFFVLGVAWANVHPSFLLAIALPLAFAAFERLEPAEARAPAGPFLLASLAATAGAFVTPQPTDLAWDAVKLFFDPTTSHIDLFNSPDFRSALWLLAPASALALAALRAVRGDARGRGGDAALLFAFVLATCTARRYGTLLVGVEIAIAGPLLDRELPPLAAFWRVPLALVAASFVGLAVVFAHEPKDPFALVPAGAVTAIKRIHAPDRVVSPYYWGGFLEWVWAGQRKVFVDGRNQYFENGAFDDAHRLEQLAGWSDVLDAYEARTVLWLRHSPLDQALAADPRWAIAYSDAMAVVYIRR